MPPTKQPQTAIVPTRFIPGSGTIVPTNRNYPLLRSERRDAIETRHQLQSIEQERIKAIKAQQAIADISHSRFATFTQTAEQMWALKETGNRPAELQQYIDHVFTQTAQRLDTYLETVTDMGASQIIRVQETPTYSPTSWKQRRFFKNRLDDE